MRTGKASVFIVSLLLICNNVLHTWCCLFGSLNRQNMHSWMYLSSILNRIYLCILLFVLHYIGLPSRHKTKTLPCDVAASSSCFEGCHDTAEMKGLSLTSDDIDVSMGSAAFVIGFERGL